MTSAIYCETLRQQEKMWPDLFTDENGDPYPILMEKTDRGNEHSERLVNRVIMFEYAIKEKGFYLVWSIRTGLVNRAKPVEVGHGAATQAMKGHAFQIEETLEPQEFKRELQAAVKFV